MKVKLLLKTNHPSNTRVIYDSNIYISFLLNSKGETISKLFSIDILKKTRLLLPEPLITEFSNRIKTKPFLSKRISPSQFENFIQNLQKFSEVIPVIKQPIPKIVRDPKDDYLIAYSIIGEADYLVSGDKDLLVLEKIGGLTIVSPRDFVTKFSS